MVNVFHMANKRIKLLWHDSNGGMTPSVVRHPIDFFKAVKKGRKTKAKTAGSASKNEWASIIRGRVINGPELNIVLLGIPFIIDVGLSAAIKSGQEAAAAKKAKKAKGKPQPKKGDYVFKGKTVANSPPAPLPHSPYSDKFEAVRQELIAAGMSAEGATAVVMSSGSSDLDDDLSVEDMALMIEVLVSMDPATLQDFKKALQ
jgi:hypothetical protein